MGKSLVELEAPPMIVQLALDRTIWATISSRLLLRGPEEVIERKVLGALTRRIS